MVIVDLLQEKGANIKKQDSDGNSALHLAALEGDFQENWFLKNFSDQKTFQCYHWASSKFQFLLSTLKNVFTFYFANKKSQFIIVTLIFNFLGHEDVVKSLIEKGVHYDEKNHDNKTPLFLATSKGSNLIYHFSNQRFISKCNESKILDAKPF